MANEYLTNEELKKLGAPELMKLVCEYITIGIDCNFEEAEVTDDGKWVNGRDLRNEIKKRFAE